MTTPTKKRVVKTPGQIDFELWWNVIGSTGSAEDGWKQTEQCFKENWERHAASLPTPIQPLTEDVPEPQKTDGELLYEAARPHTICGVLGAADDVAAEFLRLRAERDGDVAKECDMYKQLYKHALDCVDSVFQKCTEIPNPILPDFAKLGENKFSAVVRLAEEYKRLRELDGEPLEVTAEMIDEADTKWRESKGSRHERYSVAADYINTQLAELAKQAGKVGETCQ